MRHATALASIAAVVRRMERSLDEIAADAREDAEAINQSRNVIPFKKSL